MSDPKGAGDRAPQEKKGGGEGENRGCGWRPSSLKAKVLQLPCPRPQGVGRGEGLMEMKRAYMHEKPICDGVPLIAMPVCPKARCHVKPVKGHRGRGVLWEACNFNTGSQSQG